MRREWDMLAGLQAGGGNLLHGRAVQDEEVAAFLDAIIDRDENDTVILCAARPRHEDWLTWEVVLLVPSLGVDFSSLTVHLQYTPISIVSGVPRIGGAAPDEAVPPRCVFVINDWEIDVVDVPLCIAEDRVKKGEMSLKTDAEP